MPLKTGRKVSCVISRSTPAQIHEFAWVSNHIGFPHHLVLSARRRWNHSDFWIPSAFEREIPSLTRQSILCGKSLLNCFAGVIGTSPTINEIIGAGFWNHNSARILSIGDYRARDHTDKRQSSNTPLSLMIFIDSGGSGNSRLQEPTISGCSVCPHDLSQTGL